MENIELLKSSPEEDQLDMMLLMQMEKLPAEFLEQAYGSHTSLMMDFSGGSSSSCSPTGNTSTTTAMPNPFHNNQLLLPPSTTTTVPFSHSCVPTSALPTSGTACGGGGGGGEGAGNNHWRYGFNHEQFPCTPQLHGSAAANSTTTSSSSSSSSSQQQQLNHQKHNSMAAMREMIFRIAAMQPIHIDPESVKPPKRRNVKISKDPQSVAARHRRERISERIRILQRLVPGGTKMDTASMLDEAIHYVKFLKTQVQSLERASVDRPPAAMAAGVGFPVSTSNSGGRGYNNNNDYGNSFPLGMKGVHHVGHHHPLLLPGSHHQNIHHQQQQHHPYSSDA